MTCAPDGDVAAKIEAEINGSAAQSVKDRIDTCGVWLCQLTG